MPGLISRRASTANPRANLTLTVDGRATALLKTFSMILKKGFFESTHPGRYTKPTGLELAG